MKNPGPVVHGSDYHRALLVFSKELAKRFGMSPGPALGTLLRLDEAIGESVDAGCGMAALKIGVEAPEEPEP